MKYIDGDFKKGVLIDWREVRREMKKLHIPKDVYTPIIEPLEDAKYFFELSQRSIGKTTGWLLLGMVLNKLYGIQIQYIRSKEYMIEPKTLRDLMSVINSDEYDYIGQLTDNKYHSCYYHGRRWFYCNRDENGEIIDADSKHFMMCLSVDNSEQYKSSYNAPLGDLIIFDEFIGRTYPQNEFVQFLDLCKTIIRDRLSPIIVMSANTIDKHSVYFDEFGIKKDINKMNLGDQKMIETEKGTKISIHIISPVKMSQQKRLNNKLFFGFNNPKLSAITGGDWSVDAVQHIPSEKCEIISRNHYVKISTELVRLTIVKFEKLGYAVTVTNSTTLYDDSVVYTCDALVDSRYRYGIGYTRLDKLVWLLYKRNKFYYATNEQGAIIKTYLEQIKYRI